MTSRARSVLLVDDSLDTLEMYAVGLSHAGYRALTATDATSALGQLKGERPDAIVADLQLVGGRDAWALINQIKNDPSTREIPVVVLTARTDAAIAVTASQIGCAAVIAKPCLPDELAQVLRGVL